jgi:hypothetical protein
MIWLIIGDNCFGPLLADMPKHKIIPSDGVRKTSKGITDP